MVLVSAQFNWRTVHAGCSACKLERHFTHDLMCVTFPFTCVHSSSPSCSRHSLYILTYDIIMIGCYPRVAFCLAHWFSPFVGGVAEFGSKFGALILAVLHNPLEEADVRIS